MKSYPRVAINLYPDKLLKHTFRQRLFLCCLIFFNQSAYPDTPLKPFTATYSGKMSGFSTELEQNLHSENNHWLFENAATAFFISFTEQASFSLDQEKSLNPLRYQLDNPLSSKRSSDIVINANNNTFIDQLHSDKVSKMPAGALDKLSFQIQLRLDLLQQGESFTQKDYHLLDRASYKTYRVTRLKEETINTPAGRFQTVKLEQRREGKNDYTLIWLAKHKDYFIVQVQRFDEGEVKYEAILDKATVNGVSL